MKGIFYERPLHPRYTFIWDIDLILRFTKPNWDINSDLSLTGFTYKLAISLASKTTSGISAIRNLSIR